MSRLFVVKKPGVIECKYYEPGSTYQPSSRMSDIALDELVKHDFLEEKPIIHEDKDTVNGYLVSMQMKCGSLQHYLNEIIEELKNFREYWDTL